MLVLVIMLYVFMHFHILYNLFGLTYWLSAQCQFLSVFVHALQKKVKNNSAQKNPQNFLKNIQDRRAPEPEGGPEGGHPRPRRPTGEERGVVAPFGRLDQGATS